MELIVILLFAPVIALIIFSIIYVKHNNAISKRSKYNCYYLIIQFPVMGSLIYYIIRQKIRIVR
jgi:hypothetical protein